MAIKEHVSSNSFFKFNSNQLKANPLLNAVNLIFRLINKLLRFSLKIELRKVRPECDDYLLSKIESKKIKALQLSSLSQYFKRFFNSLNVNINNYDFTAMIKKYDDLFFDHPISNLNGGMTYNSGLLTFLFVNIINPDIVIESGVWKGFSTYLIDHASSSHCKIFCFDINYSKLEYRSSKATYFEQDIENSTINFSGKKVLAFFDDHVSHYHRLLYCLKQQVEHIILDDDVPLQAVHSDGWPPIPTANMLKNYEKIPHEFDWLSLGRHGMADISGLDASTVISKFHYATMSDLFQFTGFKNGSFTSILSRSDLVI
ncbi:MAG: hypothetical protein VW378_05270 [bacterium]